MLENDLGRAECGRQDPQTLNNRGANKSAHQDSLGWGPAIWIVMGLGDPLRRRILRGGTSSGESPATEDRADLVVRSVYPADLALAFVWSRERCTWRHHPGTREEYWLKNCAQSRAARL